MPGSNRRPPACKAGALPTELMPRRAIVGRNPALLGRVPIVRNRNWCPMNGAERPPIDRRASPPQRPDRPAGYLRGLCRRRTWRSCEGIEAWNQHDADLWLKNAAPDVEWMPAGPAAVEGTVYRGHDEVASGFTEIWQTWDVFHLEEAQRDLGDSVLWLGRVKMRGGASQIDLDRSSPPTPGYTTVRSSSAPVSHVARSPRSRRPLGVGDVAGERGSAAQRVYARSTEGTSKRSLRCVTQTWIRLLSPDIRSRRLSGPRRSPRELL